MLSEKQIDEIIAHAECEADEIRCELEHYEIAGVPLVGKVYEDAERYDHIAEGFKELKEARRMLDAMGWHYHDGNYYNDKAHKEYFGEVK